MCILTKKSTYGFSFFSISVSCFYCVSSCSPSPMLMMIMMRRMIDCHHCCNIPRGVAAQVSRMVTMSPRILTPQTSGPLRRSCSRYYPRPGSCSASSSRRWRWSRPCSACAWCRDRGRHSSGGCPRTTSRCLCPCPSRSRAGQLLSYECAS